MLNDSLFITVQSAAEFYDNIHNYFSSAWNQAELLPSLVLAALVFVLLVGGGIFFMRWRASRRKYVPSGILNDKNKVSEVLEACVDVWAHMDFQLNYEDGRSLFYSGIAIKLTSKELVLECFSSPTELSSLYPGREVKFFFMLKAKHPEFYHFDTKVIKTVATKKDQFRFYVCIPSELKPGQKRNFLRIDPPESLVLGSAIWPYEGNKEMFKRPVSEWDKPLLVYSSEDSFQFKIRDLSANGAGLNIPQEYAKLEALSFGKKRLFMMMLNLWAPVQQSSLKIWTICRVQTSVPNQELGGLKVGVQFLAWGQIRNANTETLVWRKLESSEGIGQLADWIIRRNLEGNRVHTNSLLMMQ